MLIPCGHRVLVKTEDYDQHDEVFKRARALDIEIVKDSKTRYQASVDEGIVVSTGPTAWADFGEPWAEVGDRIIFAKNAGKPVVDPEDKKTNYVVLNDEDVILVVRGKQ